MLIGMLSGVAALLAAVQAAAVVDPTKPIESVVIHPLVASDFACAEHWEGQLKSLGDSLGSDCMVFGGMDAKAGPAGGFLRPFRGDGLRNEDWYAWGQRVLAPFDAVVERVHENAVVNSPGILGKPPASFILFRREDGVRVIYAHIQKPTVKAGDSVTAGQPVAEVGNNGYGRLPHIHIGAWRERTPLQIRFDLRAMAKVREAAP